MSTAQLWKNLQAQYDLEVANQKTGKQVKRGTRPFRQPDVRALLAG